MEGRGFMVSEVGGLERKTLLGKPPHFTVLTKSLSWGRGSLCPGEVGGGAM